jgi:hypothetical protein
MAKGELLREFENVVCEFVKTHTEEPKRCVTWGKMPNEMLFGQADISSNDFVLILLRMFRIAGGRIIDSGVWQPFPNFVFPANSSIDKLHAEETFDWSAELGGLVSRGTTCAPGVIFSLFFLCRLLFLCQPLFCRLCQ